MFRQRHHNRSLGKGCQIVQGVIWVITAVIVGFIALDTIEVSRHVINRHLIVSEHEISTKIREQVSDVLMEQQVLPKILDNFRLKGPDEGG